MSIKLNKKYPSVYENYKDDKDGYQLICIEEVYFPFWLCQQEITVDKNVKADKFSRILLELVDNGIKKHSDICSFLGIKENDFTLMQLDFLIKNNFLKESSSVSYGITPDGKDFLKGESESLKHEESIDFEYIISQLEVVTEHRVECFFDGHSKDFFDKYENDDENNFQGYQIRPTHELRKNPNISNERIIPHKDKPTLSRIDKSDFVKFFNDSYKEDGDFHDMYKIKNKRQRSVLFFVLVFEDENGDREMDVRRCKDSVKEFNGEEKEHKLTREFKEYCKHCEEGIDFLDKLINIE